MVYRRHGVGAESLLERYARQLSREIATLSASLAGAADHLQSGRFTKPDLQPGPVLEDLARLREETLGAVSAAEVLAGYERVLGLPVSADTQPAAILGGIDRHAAVWKLAARWQEVRQTFATTPFSVLRPEVIDEYITGAHTECVVNCFVFSAGERGGGVWMLIRCACDGDSDVPSRFFHLCL